MKVLRVILCGLLISLCFAKQQREEGHKEFMSAQIVFGKEVLDTSELQTELPFYHFPQMKTVRSRERGTGTSRRYRDCNGETLRSLSKQWEDEGWIILTPCSAVYNSFALDAAANLTSKCLDTNSVREVNAFTYDPHVRMLAIDPETLYVLEALHGGVKPYPFQTLNFPRGTTQAIHNDLIHFSTHPQGMMAAAWIALEDIKSDSGPLEFYPGSHKLGMQYYEELGVQADGTDEERYADYEKQLAAYIVKKGLVKKTAPEMKKGQILMWAAALLHGGSAITNASSTRLSQVNHYYFEGVKHAWVPRMSRLDKGVVRMRGPSFSTNPKKYTVYRKAWMRGVGPSVS